MLDVVMEIESIVKAVENKVISRSVANGLIKKLLANVPKHPMEGVIVNCGQCGEEHTCYL